MTASHRFSGAALFVSGIIAVGAIGVANTGSAHAQKYPEKTVRIVTPFAPGGGTDVFARMLAQRLTEVYGQQFIVENRPGAGSTLGTEYVAKSPPDGYTLLMTSASFSFNPGLYPKLRYDPVKDFARRVAGRARAARDRRAAVVSRDEPAGVREARARASRRRALRVLGPGQRDASRRRALRHGHEDEAHARALQGRRRDRRRRCSAAKRRPRSIRSRR